MTEPPTGRSLTGLAIVGAVMCCGLPLLLAAGSAVAFAGIGLRSLALALAGVAAVVLGGWELRRRRGSCETTASALNSHGKS